MGLMSTGVYTRIEASVEWDGDIRIPLQHYSISQDLLRPTTDVAPLLTITGSAHFQNALDDVRTNGMWAKQYNLIIVNSLIKSLRTNTFTACANQ